MGWCRAILQGDDAGGRAVPVLVQWQLLWPHRSVPMVPVLLQAPHQLLPTPPAVKESGDTTAVFCDLHLKSFPLSDAASEWDLAGQCWLACTGWEHF